jgi:aconitase A
MVSAGAMYGSGVRGPGRRRDSAGGLTAVATSYERILRLNLIGMGSCAVVVVQRDG